MTTSVTTGMTASVTPRRGPEKARQGPEKTRLGLDIGTNSIGWCLFELDADNEPCAIIKAGSRIFSDGRDAKSYTSLKAERRVSRQASRRRDRYLRRREALMKALIRHGFMPKDEAERKKLADSDPYEIRDKALTQEIPVFDIGRAIFHLNQRRGFKSNRKTADNEAGVVKRSIADFEQRLSEEGKKSIGSFLAKRRTRGESVRARRTGTKSDDLYELYPSRAMYEAEFDLIWQKQAAQNPGFYTDAKREEIRKIIFFQRKLKPQKKGRCTFMPDEDRAAKALPSFQRFRIYQEIHNLAWIDRWGRAHLVRENRAVRDALVAELESKRKMTFASMRRMLKKMGVVEYDVGFNLESDKRKELEGNIVSAEMRHEDRIGKAWDEWDTEKQDALIELLIDDEIEDDEAADRLIQDFGIPQEEGERIEKILNAKLPSGYGQLCKEAIGKIVSVMATKHELQYHKAVKEAGFGAHNRYDGDRHLDDHLEYYGEVLRGDVLPGSGEEKDRHDDARFWGEIPNPTVHIALNQIRAVVNELIRLYGKPEQIIIELARDLPEGADARKETISRQAKNQRENDRIKEELQALGQDINRANIQRVKLWKELAENPMDRKCVFCGTMIPKADLFSPGFEIEHLLPFSRTLDDGMANKTVSCRKCNRKKGNQSPHEAFGTNDDWERIIERSGTLPKSKKWRFQPDAMEKRDEEDDFRERQLNDTRYISTYTKRYLASVVNEKNILVVTGRLTAMLRHHWGLNSVLRGDNAPEEERNKKLRDDHRHHAIDAVVIGMCSRSMIQRVSTVAGRAEEMALEHIFPDGRAIDPWEGFRAEVMDAMGRIVVSHRARKKNQGALHRSTAYAVLGDKAVKRVDIAALKSVENIKDDNIRTELESLTLGLNPKETATAIQDWCKDKGIRRLKCYYTKTKVEDMIPIRDREGKPFKFFEGYSNAWMDIYPDKRGKWQGEAVRRFDANQAGFIPKWRRENPTLKRTMQLRIDDCLKMAIDGQDCLVRIQKLSAGEITLAPLHEANVSARNGDKEDSFKFTRIAPSALQKANARKVHISPTGLVREENNEGTDS